MHNTIAFSVNDNKKLYFILEDNSKIDSIFLADEHSIQSVDINYVQWYHKEVYEKINKYIVLI